MAHHERGPVVGRPAQPLPERAADPRGHVGQRSPSRRATAGPQGRRARRLDLARGEPLPRSDVALDESLVGGDGRPEPRADDRRPSRGSRRAASYQRSCHVAQDGARRAPRPVGRRAGAPRPSSGESARPCHRRSRFHFDSPWRTTARVGAGPARREGTGCTVRVRVAIRPASAAPVRSGRGQWCGCSPRPGRPPARGRDEVPGDTVDAVLGAAGTATAPASPRCWLRAASGSTANRPTAETARGRPTTRSPCCRPCRVARGDRRDDRRAAAPSRRAAGARRRRVVRAPGRPRPRRPRPRRPGPCSATTATRRRYSSAATCSPACARCCRTGCSAARRARRRGRPRTTAITRSPPSSTHCAPSTVSAGSTSSPTARWRSWSRALDAFEQGCRHDAGAVFAELDGLTEALVERYRESVAAGGERPERGTD